MIRIHRYLDHIASRTCVDLPSLAVPHDRGQPIFVVYDRAITSIDDHILDRHPINLRNNVDAIWVNG